MKTYKSTETSAIITGARREWHRVGATFKARLSLEYKNGKLEAVVDWLPHVPAIEDLGKTLDGEAFQNYWDAFHVSVLMTAKPNYFAVED